MMATLPGRTMRAADRSGEGSARPPRSNAIEAHHPVAPVPVETMRPDDDCRSVCPLGWVKLGAVMEYLADWCEACPTKTSLSAESCWPSSSVAVTVVRL